MPICPIFWPNVISLILYSQSERDYERQASRLLEMLPERGNKAFYTLLEILEVTNPWLAEKMKAALHEERNKDAKINIHPVLQQNGECYIVTVEW